MENFECFYGGFGLRFLGLDGVSSYQKREQIQQERNKYIKIIEKLSITDPLTNLYNRRYFSNAMQKEINRAKRQNIHLSFLMLDIDFFKKYNDIYGHQMGDEALIQVANVIKKSTQRANDYSFRLGGEEFGLTFIDLDEKQSLFLAERIRKNIESLQIIHEGNTASKFLTASFGLVCTKGAMIIDTDTIYKEADDMLYKAKESGRNKIVVNNLS